MRSTLLPRSALYSLAILVAVIVAFAAFHQINGTRAECQGSTCIVTMDGVDSRVTTFGQELRFFGADGRVALFGVQGKSFGCVEGEAVAVGGLHMVCEKVGSDIVRAEVTHSIA